VRHFERGLEPLKRLLFEAATNDALEIARQIGAQARERRGPIAQNRGAQIGMAYARERPRAARQLVDQDTEREQIRPRVQRLAPQLLGRHVRSRAHHLPGM
jgi:hypothetical protein